MPRPTGTGRTYANRSVIMNSPPTGSAGLDAEVILRVTLSKARSVKESVELLHQIETLVSLLCFDYIKASRFEFASVLSDGKERSLPVARAQFVEGKEEINWKKLPLVLSDQNFGAIVDAFIEIHPVINQTLDWYRIVQAETRYVEDRFLYAVRMIEALYRAFDLGHEIDLEALSLIERVLQKCEDDANLKEFIAMRVVPMFKKRWSLTQIIRDLRKRYGEMIAVEFLDPVMIHRLRGKETHGSSGRIQAKNLHLWDMRPAC